MALWFLLGAFALWWVWPRGRAGVKQIDPLAAARAQLGLERGAGADAIEAAFRAQLHSAHPDAGGSDEATRGLTEARDLLLRSLKRASD